MPKSNWALSDAPAQRLNAAEAKGPFSSNWGHSQFSAVVSAPALTIAGEEGGLFADQTRIATDA